MATTEQLQKIAESYLVTVVNEDANTLVALLGKNAIVEDPRYPGNKGESDLRSLVAKFQEFFNPMSPRPEFVRTTVAQEQGRVLCESMLHVDNKGEKWALPVGVVASNDPEGGAARVHVYYTSWPFNKHHSIRSALYTHPQPKNAEFKGQLRTWIQSLRAGDIETASGTWEADIYMREASGLPYLHWGKIAFANYLKGLFAAGAPMIIPSTVNEGGRIVFMEFTFAGWGRVKRPEEQYECGLAVYECTSPEGLLRAIRIYDDIAF